MAVKHACSVCSKTCKTDCIYCETCKMWTHSKCQEMSESSCKKWAETSTGYICKQCRSTDNGEFDFLLGLERLKQAAKSGVKKLRTAVNRETLLLENVTLDTSLHQNFAGMEQDALSNTLLTHYHFNDKIALVSSADGDCLFNAFSILLTGNESRSTELRYRCCIEMTTNKEKITTHRLYPRLLLISPDLEKDAVDCAKPGSYSSVWRLIALSNLLNLTVESVYPNLNGSKHLAFQCLNHVFRPPFAHPDTNQ